MVEAKFGRKFCNKRTRFFLNRNYLEGNGESRGEREDEGEGESEGEGDSEGVGEILGVFSTQEALLQ